MIIHFGALPVLEDGSSHGVATNLIMCDHCGTVAADAWNFGWKTFREHNIHRHHCPYAVETNELRRFGLVYGQERKEVVDYDDWDEP